MKTSILIATSSLQAVQAAQATGSIVNDGCEAIKWNGEKIPFQEQLSFCASSLRLLRKQFIFNRMKAPS